jgi:sterol desaturase/sphingolipid hydroxylase (fatty acid hydroxylase superfamily)
MTESLLATEPQLRLIVFLGVLVAMALWELAVPRRRQEIPRVIRWTNNLGLVVIDTIVLRLIFPILAVGLAVIAQDRGWGLFNVIEAPGWIAVLVSIVVLDLVIYLQHVMFHAVPALWRLHRMHHADLEFDVTTGLRFHPVEILLSMGIKLAVVMALGPPAVAVLIFEVLLNATAMFNHSNIRLPTFVDRILRLIVVTPDMHRVHHSIIPEETNSNFGFNLPWWDRLLGTYKAQPKAGHEGMSIGIEQFRTTRDLWLDRMLVQPVKGPASGYVPCLARRLVGASVGGLHLPAANTELGPEARHTSRPGPGSRG